VAVARGADIALLPELPMDRWAPATREPSDTDAEPPRGTRWAAQAEAARSAGVYLVGGAIVRDPGTDRRHNTAFVFDRDGREVAAYRKAHLPCEEGFWEADHYEPGDAWAEPVALSPITVGVQICSDANRPAGSQVLAAAGAELIVVPRATPGASWERWKLVLRANAVTASVFVATLNRPGPEAGVPIGGPSAVFGPDGAVIVETPDPLEIVTIERDSLDRARRGYPGYLSVRPRLYASAWASVSGAKPGEDADPPGS
jgi:predicted amidohydrolase